MLKAVATSAADATGTTAAAVIGDDRIVRGDGGARGVQSSSVVLSDAGQISWITGLGAITHLAGPSDQPFAMAATVPVQAASSVAGNAVTLTASAATAGSSVAGAAAGGGITLTGGSAARLTSGNAAGGGISLAAGTSTGNTAGPAVSITAGGNNVNGAGGQIIIAGGLSGRVDAGGGQVSITAGATIAGAQAGANSGVVAIASGAVGTSSLNSGTAGSSGAITIATAAGGTASGTTSAGGNSGSVTISTGAGGTGTSTNGTPGNIVLAPGGTTVFTVTPNGSIRVGDTSVSTQFDATNTSTLANVTGLTSGTLAAAGRYGFEAVLHVTADAIGGYKVAIAGTATATAVIYQVNALDNSTNLFTATSRQTALGGAVGAAGPTGAFIKIEGNITVNAAGTLTVQFAQNVATPATTSSVLVGSNFRVWRIA